MGKTAPTLKAKATDPDSDLSRMEFQIGLANSSTHTSVFATGIDDGETAEVKLNQSNTYTLAHGKTYEWRVRAWDPKVSGPYAPTSGTDWCRFTYDTDLPDSPSLVTSTEFPADSDNDSNGEVWSKVKFGTAGNFTFTKGADTDIVKFVFSINNTTYDHYACAGTKQGTGSATCTTVISSTEDYAGMRPHRRPQHPVRQGRRLGGQHLAEPVQAHLLRHPAPDRRRRRRPQRRRRRRLRAHHRRRKPLDQHDRPLRRLDRQLLGPARQRDTAAREHHRPAHLER